MAKRVDAVEDMQKGNPIEGSRALLPVRKKQRNLKQGIKKPDLTDKTRFIRLNNLVNRFG